jgi:hypothetical protein
MVKRIADPLPESHRREEAVRLSQLIELGIPIQHSGRNKLIKDTDDQWGEDGENNVVE